MISTSAEISFLFSLGLQSVNQACNPLSRRFSCRRCGERSVVVMRATTHKSRQTYQGKRFKSWKSLPIHVRRRRCQRPVRTPPRVTCVLLCTGTVAVRFHTVPCGRGEISRTCGLAGRQSVGVMRATTHRMRKICPQNVQQRPRSCLTGP